MPAAVRQKELVEPPGSITESEVSPSGEVTRKTFLSASYVIEVRRLFMSPGEHSAHIASVREGQLSQVSQRAVRMGTPLDGHSQACLRVERRQVRVFDCDPDVVIVGDEVALEIGSAFMQ